MALPLQKSPEVPQSGTHHHPLPPNPHSGPVHHLPPSPLTVFCCFFKILIYWGGGPDILTPSHPSLGSLAVMSVSSDLCWPLGYSSLPLTLHGDVPKVSGTFDGGLLRIFRLVMHVWASAETLAWNQWSGCSHAAFFNLLWSNLTDYNNPIPQPHDFFFLNIYSFLGHHYNPNPNIWLKKYSINCSDKMNATFPSPWSTARHVLCSLWPSKQTSAIHLMS